MPKAKAPRQHPDQSYIPGAEPILNERISTAAKHYRKQRDTRMKWTEKEKEAKDTLIAAMKEEGMKLYVDPSGFAVTLLTNDNVKVSEDDGARGKGEDNGEE